VQAVALLNAYACRGLWCAGRVGAGKTLICALLPTILAAKRPLLLTKGSLAKETPDIHSKLRAHWKIQTNIRIMSYGLLSHRKHERELWDYNPDVIICDEMHMLNHIETASCARRMSRFMFERPDKIWNGLSGSPGDDLQQIGPHINWALKGKSPLPLDPDTLEIWSDIVSDTTEKRGKIRGDIRQLWPHVGQCETIREAKELIGNRLFSTPGIIISTDKFEAGLEMYPVYWHSDQAINTAYHDLRNTWQCPDGWILGDPRLGVYPIARELCLGFFSGYDPRPPKDWFEARRAWFSCVRWIISESDWLDSQKQVEDAVIAGRKLFEGMPPDVLIEARRLLAEWQLIEPSFVPKSVTKWISSKPLEQCAKWGKDGGIIWVHRTALGEEISRLTGWSFFGAEGLDKQGRFIENVKEKTIVASVASCGTGKNLQYNWHRNLFTSMTSSAKEAEQNIGRTHRDGQTKETVEVFYGVGCLENIDGLYRAWQKAESIELEQRSPQKLRLATIIWPHMGRGPAFEKTKGSREEKE